MFLTAAIKRVRGPRAWVAIGLVCAVGAGCAVLVVGRGARAELGGPPQGYSVLKSSAPSGLTVISSPAAMKQVAGPVWIAQAEGPVIATAREAASSVAGLRLWVANAHDGGVCILAMPVGQAGVRGPGASCTAKGSREAGAAIESPATAAGPGVLAGTVPDGVSSVAVSFADGSSQTAPVAQNVYALPTKGTATKATFTRAGVQHTTRIGG